MAYDIIITSFVRVENFNSSLFELSVSFVKGGNCVCSPLTVEIEAK